MNLEYKINIHQKRVPNFTKDSYRISNDFRVIKSDRSFLIESEDTLQGSGFIKTEEMLAATNKIEDFIVGYQDKKSFNEDESNFQKEIFPVSNLNKFLLDYRLYIKEIKNNIIDHSITIDDTVHVLYWDNESLNILDKNSYDINYKTFKLVLNGSVNSDYLFTVTFKTQYKYKKTSDRFELNLEQLLDIEPGFYNIYPKKIYSNYSLVKEGDQYILNNSEALKIQSDVSISFDNLNSDQFLVPPKNQTILNYSFQNLSDLDNVGEFDYTDEKQYIIFLLEDNQYKKVFTLPENKDDDNFNILMNSHTEFKRPYSFIANKSEVLIKDFNDRLLEKIIVYNKDFKNIYDRP